MPLRRGFKAEAERLADNVRNELGLRKNQSVSVNALAEFLEVMIIAGDDLIPRKRFVELKRLQEDAFSACTFHPSGGHTVVVFNPLSSQARQTSDVMHELAHLVLEHELSRVQTIGGMTFRSCDLEQEDEAAWLSGCLLLPRQLLLSAVRRGMSELQIAKANGVSERMARYRVNVTGVKRQIGSVPRR